MGKEFEGIDLADMQAAPDGKILKKVSGKWVSADESAGSGAHMDTSFSPAGLYLFDEDVTDSSGNSRDLTVSSGAEQYAPFSHVKGDLAIPVGTAGVHFTQSDAAFRTLGAVSFMCVISPRALSGVIVLMACEAPGAAEADNANYALHLMDDKLRYFCETGPAGADVFVTAEESLQIGQPQIVGFTRNSGGDEVKVFVNGYKVAENLSTTVPTGGGNATLSIGAGATGANQFIGVLGECQIITSELTEQQMADEAARLFGF